MIRRHEIHRPLLWLSAALAVHLLLTVIVPDLRIAVTSASVRLALEVVMVSVMAGAAILMALMERSGLPTGRDAFVAALVVQCLATTAFGIVPSLLDHPPDLIGSYYPWLVGRYIAGLLLTAAALRARPGRVAPAVLVAVVSVLVVEVAISLSDPFVPLQVTSDGSVTPQPLHYLLEIVPAGLFAWGALAASDHAATTGDPLDRWFSLALVVAAFAQVHDALFPAALGPVVTSTDVLSVGLSGLLLVGVGLQVRNLLQQRDRAVGLLREDLRSSARVLKEVRAAREREAAFVSVITHELTSPVAAINAQAHVLDAMAPSALRDPVVAVRDEAARLAVLVRRMEELRRIDDEEFSVQQRPVAIVPLLDEAAAFARSMPEALHASVDASPARVLADPVRLGQVLRNVVANAARHAPAGSSLQISGRRDDRRYVIVVADAGPGLAGIDPEQLFQPWVRGADATTSEGTCLGLYLSGRIMTDNDGSITFEDPDEPGARVRIELVVQ